MTRAKQIGQHMTLAWAAGVLVVAGLSTWLYETRPTSLIPLYYTWAAIGAVLLIGLLVARQPRSVGFLVVLGALSVPLWPVADSLGGQAWFRINYERNKTAYAAVVADVRTLPPEGEHHGVRYRVEADAPLRIAFPITTSADQREWGAVIYDPTHAVAAARGWDRERGRFTAGADIRHLWGGDLLSCTKITEDYYRCDFTKALDAPSPAA